MIGCLFYFTASRRDLLLSFGICARFQSCSKVSHNVVKRIFKYLKGIIHVGLWYHKNITIDLLVYSDADFTGCLIERKSTSCC